MSLTMTSTQTCCRYLTTKGDSLKDSLRPEPRFIIHRVPQTKLQKAIKRRIEDEIPFLDTYTEEQKNIYQTEKMSRIEEPKRISKTEECYLYTSKFYYVTDESVKSVDLEEVLKRTIYDEIPHLTEKFKKPKNSKQQRR